MVVKCILSWTIKQGKKVVGEEYMDVLADPALITKCMKLEGADIMYLTPVPDGPKEGD